MESVKFFKALADPTRVRLIHLLQHYELNVGEIVQIMDMGQSRISRHLKILSDCGLLTSRRDGMWVFYRAARGGKEQMFLQALAPFLASEEDLAPDLQRAGDVTRERIHSTQQFFDDVAAQWGYVGREALGGFDISPHIERMMPECTRAVDLGCGPGELLPVLTKRAHSVIGVDNSSKMLTLARANLPGDLDISLRLGDLAHLPLRDRECDFAVLSMVLHHLVSPGAALHEAARILRPGGQLVVADFAPHEQEAMRAAYSDRWLGFSVEEIRHWLAAAGLEAVEQTPVPADQGLEVVVYTGCKPGEAAVGEERRNSMRRGARPRL